MAKGFCAYCGEYGSLTKEHVWGKVNKKLVNQRFKYSDHTIRRPTQNHGQPSMTFGKGATSRAGDPRSLSLCIVCKKCNETWMGLIQQEANGILKRLVIGEQWNLSECEQRILARWVILFSMSFEYADRETISISQKDRTAFMKGIDFVDNFWVQIALYEGELWESQTNHRSFGISPISGPLTDRPNAQVTVSTLGKLAFRCVSMPVGVEIDQINYLDYKLFEIWPVSNISYGAALAAEDQSMGFYAYELINRELSGYEMN